MRALVRDAEKAKRLLSPLGIADEDLVVGSMTDEGAVGRALESCDAVIHAAAGVSVTKTGAEDAFQDNVTGTRLVLGLACERGLETVIFVSSLIAIFDPNSSDATTAASPLVESATRYGRSKAASDAFARGLQRDGAPIAIVYPPGVIGPDDPGRSESMRAYRGFVQAMIVSGGGTQFVDVRDLAILLERVLAERRHERIVVAGDFFRWSELRDSIVEVTGAQIGRIRAPGWLLRTAGRIADLLSRFSGRSLPITREGMEVATRWRPIEDSPAVSELGVRWRDPRQTLADVYAWFVEVGAIRAAAVPRLSRSESP